MADPQDLRIPDHVPDELVEAYGTAAPERPAAGPSAALVQLRASARTDTRLVGLALACCVAVVVGILVALVTWAPAPLTAGAALLTLLVVGGITGRLIGRALLRSNRDERPGQ